jgi:Salmonella virulence plasmid 65kDa B protein
MFRIVSVLIFFCLSSTVLAGFTQYPTSIDDDGAYELAWSGPTYSGLFSTSIKEYKNGTYLGVVSSAASSSTYLTGRLDGTYVYEIWATVSYYDSSTGEYLTRYIKDDNITVTVKVAVELTPPPAFTTKQFSGDGNYTVSWGAVSNAETYTLQESKNGSGWSTIQDNASTSIEFSVKPEGNYAYQVKACDGSNCSNWTAAITTQVIYPPATAPSFTSAVTQVTYSLSTRLDIDWSSISNASSYELREYVDNSWKERSRGSSRSEDFSDRALGNYIFRVKACNLGGCSSWNTQTFTVSQVTDISGPAFSRGTFTLSLLGFSYYRNLLENGQSLILKYFGSTITLTKEDGAYTYQAQTCNYGPEDGAPIICGNYGLGFTVNVLNPAGIPATIDTPATNDDGEFTVSWAAASGAVHRYVLQQQWNGGDWESIYSGTDRSKPVDQLIDGRYSYRVKACNTLNGEELCSSYRTASSTIVANAPTMPSSISVPSFDSDGSFTISWGAASGYIDAYELDQNHNNVGWENIDSGTSLSYGAELLPAGQYVFQVRACNTESTYTACSNNQISQTLTLAAPVAPTISGPDTNTSGSYTLSWQSVVNADSYRLEESRDHGEWITRQEGSNTTYSVNNNDYDRYVYRLYACNRFGCSNSNKTVDIVPEFVTQIPDVDLVDPNLPTPDIVGALPGDLTINGGAATYTVPLSIAPGRHGMQPEISLRYNSQSGEGVAGYGWSLQANSTISRCASSYAIDGAKRKVQLDAADKLCLDGQRLIVISGTYGHHGSEYYTEKYNGQRIRLVNGIQSSNSYFEVVGNDNRERVYGKSDNSSFSPVGKSAIMNWHLYKITDSENNSIIYTYDNTDGESTLVSIWYTGEGDNKGSRKIHFEYIDKELTHIGYIAGASYKIGKMLDRITLSIDSIDSDYYQFDYQGSPKKLNRLSHCTIDSSTHCLYTDFEWYSETGTFTEDEDIYWKPMDPNINNHGLKITVIGEKDYDGDGIFDLFKDGYYFLSSLTGKRFPTSDSDWVAISGFEGASYNTVNYPFQGRFDANGDGGDDWLYVDSTKNVKIARWNQQTKSVDLTDTGINVSCSPILRISSILPIDGMCTSKLADFDGDGINDLLLAYGNGSNINYISHRVYKGCLLGDSGCSGGFIDQGITFELPRNGDSSMMDIDGDGLLDVVRLTSEITWYKTSLTNNGFTMQYRSVAHALPGSRSQDGRTTHFWMDANKDGMPDLLALGSPDNTHYFWYYLTNLGNGNFSSPLNTHEPEFLISELIRNSQPTNIGLAYNQFVRQIDYNNDGGQDLLVPRKFVSANCLDRIHLPCGLDSDAELYHSKFDIYLWDVVLVKENAGQIDFEYIDLGGFASHGDLIYTHDINGDGLQDISAFLGLEAYWYKNGVRTYPHYEYRFTQSKGVHSWPRDYHNGNLLKNVVTQNGRVETAQLTYKPLSFDHDDGSKIYSPTTDAVQFPYTKFTNGMKVVSEIDRDNGIGGVNTTRYYFEKAMYHLQGRGFQGFGTIVEESLARDTAIERKYYQQYPNSGIVSSRKTTQSDRNGTLLESYAVSELDRVTELPNGVTFPYVKSDTSNRYDLTNANQIASVITTNTYDEKANLIKQEVVTNDATLTHTQLLERDYIDNANCANLLAFEKNTANVDYKLYRGSPALTTDTVWKSTRTTDWTGCQPLQQELQASDSQANDSASGAQVLLEYDYDYYGNLETLITSGGEEKTRIEQRIVTTLYDSSGYFIENIKNNQWGDFIYTHTDYNNRFGKPTSESDVNGLITTNYYNGFGQLEKTVYPTTQDGSTPDTHYIRQWCDSSCPDNALIKLTQIQAGLPTKITHLDSKERTLQSETIGFDGASIITSTGYDELGRVTQQIQPHYAGNSGATITYADYDALDRPSSQTVQSQPLEYISTYNYQGLDTTVSVSSMAGDFTVSRTYNSLGQLSVTEDALQNQAYFQYDGFGKAIRLIDVNTNIISAGFDGFGNKQWFDDPSGALFITGWES